MIIFSQAWIILTTINNVLSGTPSAVQSLATATLRFQPFLLKIWNLNVKVTTNALIKISIVNDHDHYEQDSWVAGYFRDCNGQSNGQVSPDHHHHCHHHTGLPHQYLDVGHDADPEQALEGGVIREEALEAASSQGQSLVSAEYLGISQVDWKIALWINFLIGYALSYCCYTVLVSVYEKSLKLRNSSQYSFNHV